MRRVVAFASVVVVVVVTVLVAAPDTPASASTPPVLSTSTVGEAADYRSDRWANPWDFSDSSDFGNLPGLWNPNSDVSVAGGELRITDRNGAIINLLQTRTYPPAADDAFSRPLLPTTYSRISMRLYAPATTNVMIDWMDCLFGSRFDGSSCATRRYFQAQAGWHTYDFDPMQLPQCCGSTESHSWNRPVGTIRLSMGAHSDLRTHRIDWVRIYRPSGDVAVNVGASGADEVWWDLDADQGNNEGSSRAGRLERFVGGPQGQTAFIDPVAPNGTATFNSSAFPPGTYRFYPGPTASTR